MTLRIDYGGESRSVFSIRRYDVTHMRDGRSRLWFTEEGESSSREMVMEHNSTAYVMNERGVTIDVIIAGGEDHGKRKDKRTNAGSVNNATAADNHASVRR